MATWLHRIALSHVIPSFSGFVLVWPYVALSLLVELDEESVGCMYMGGAAST